MGESVSHRYPPRAVGPVVTARAALSEDHRLLGQRTIADRREGRGADRALRERAGILSLGVMHADPQAWGPDDELAEARPTDRRERLLPPDLAQQGVAEGGLGREERLASTNDVSCEPLDQLGGGSPELDRPVLPRPMLVRDSLLGRGSPPRRSVGRGRPRAVQCRAVRRKASRSSARGRPPPRGGPRAA